MIGYYDPVAERAETLRQVWRHGFHSMGFI